MPYRRLAFRRPQLPDGSDGLRLEVRTFLREQVFEPRCDSWLSGFDPEFSRRLAARGWVGTMGAQSLYYVCCKCVARKMAAS